MSIQGRESGASTCLGFRRACALPISFYQPEQLTTFGLPDVTIP
jgi:hypothetical protein